MVQAALEKLNNNYMIVLGAVGVLFLSLLIFLFSYVSLSTATALHLSALLTRVTNDMTQQTVS